MQEIEIIHFKWYPSYINSFWVLQSVWVYPKKFAIAVSSQFGKAHKENIHKMTKFQTLGFVLGPAIQSALSPLGETVYVKPQSDFIFDMYTATG